MEIPALTTNQMIEVDRLMIEDYGISLIQMMENAGRNLAELTSRMLNRSLFGRSICVLCGRGNNGGGGMVAARHLHNRGANVSLIRLSGDLKDVSKYQWKILENMGIHNDTNFDLTKADIVLDALIGYGLQGDPRPELAEWIEKINQSNITVLALDSPSGLDTTSGTGSRHTVRADATMTLALPKVGLLSETAKEFVGELFLADISVPPKLYRQIGIEVGNYFEQDSIYKFTE